MMRSLFHAFERHDVRYLVISGQASVLYGAALFSQDLDLWIEPKERNVSATLRALQELRARVHKLTPPFTVSYLLRGHGFHFIIPQRPGPSLYLDLMGRPPRVGRFAAAARRAEEMQTPWGKVPVVCIEDLVELKKTNRPADYEVISRLALIRLDREPTPNRRLLSWALENIFRVEDLWAVIQRFGSIISSRDWGQSPEVRALYRLYREGRTPSASQLSRAAQPLARRAERYQRLGRAYWTPILDELRQLRATGRLLSEGARIYCPSR